MEYAYAYYRDNPIKGPYLVIRVENPQEALEAIADSGIKIFKGERYIHFRCKPLPYAKDTGGLTLNEHRSDSFFPWTD